MKTQRFHIKWHEFRSVIGAEYRHIYHDAGVILVLVFALLIYSTAYSLAYKNEVLRNVPIGVVDMSKTASSRTLAETFAAAPNVVVAYNPESMEEAKNLFYARKIYGIVYIPQDYENKIMRGEQAIVGVYVDASYFLMYRQVFYDVVNGIGDLSTQVEVKRLLAAGASLPQAAAVSAPMEYKAKNLFNPYTGYGTFIMPAIIMVIIQQTLLIGVGMIGGTWREFGVYKRLIPPGERRLSTLPIVLGKTVVYLSIYAVTLTYILSLHYRLFGYPMNGSFWTIVAFLVPYLLSCIFLAIAISTLFRYRENSILFMLWGSIPLLLLSGASVPKEAIPHWLFTLGKVFPSSSGVDGFLRIQTMGADLSEVFPQFRLLWILAAVYLVLACVGIRIVLNRPDTK